MFTQLFVVKFRGAKDFIEAKISKISHVKSGTFITSVTLSNLRIANHPHYIDKYEIGRLFEFMSLAYLVENVVDIKRLGEKSPNKIMVLRINFRSEFDREELVRTRFSLKGSEEYSQVYLSRDLMYDKRVEQSIKIMRKRQNNNLPGAARVVNNNDSQITTAETVSETRTNETETEASRRTHESIENSPVEGEEVTSHPQNSGQQIQP